MHFTKPGKKAVTSQSHAREPVNSEAPSPALVIAYLAYALKDVRALSPRGTSLLESAIEVLREETATSALSADDMH